MELKEDQLTFLQQYKELINTVEQAILYIENQPVEDQLDATRQMMPDVLAAYMQLNNAHGYLKELLQGDEEVMHNIDTFNQMVAEAKDIQEINTMANRFATKMIPRFKLWKERTESAVLPYIQQ